ncbi:MAG: DUF3857 and transglutaminase domain-containing protein [candidate division Zixibacteria bacterium]|nr:DUF3857 and transglutaminase domain-containing protein [candidate division Zixibacteria bacterium]
MMFSMTAFLRKLVVCFAVVLPAFASAEDYKWGEVSDEEWQTGAPAEYPEANAVILFDRGEMTVTRDIIKIDYHVRIKVLTRAGIEEVSEREIWYRPEYEKLKGLEAHTITPEGKKLKVDKKSIFEKESGNYKFLSFAFPSLDSGCIVEYKYQIRSDNFFYLKSWYFQNEIYTMKSEFSTCLYPGFSYDVTYQAIPSHLQSPNVEEKPCPDYSFGVVLNMKIMTWVLENQPPVKDEPYMSCVNDYRAAVRFQFDSYRLGNHWQEFRKNWVELGDLVVKDIDNYINNRGQIKELAEEVTAGLTTVREKSRAIYDYVCKEYRTSDEDWLWYFSNEKVSRLLAEKRGSAVEKNLLLAAMHHAADIPAWPVLISTRENSRFNPQYGSLRQFNYLITFAQFGNEWEFFDTSDRLSPYGLLPPSCLTDGGLLLEKGNSSLVRITIKPIMSERTDITRMFVAADGSAACSSYCCFAGYYGSDYGDRYEETPAEDFIDDYFVSALGVPTTVGGYTCEMDTLDQFVAQLAFTSDDLTRKLDNNVVVRPVSYGFRANPFKSEKRFFPVDFCYPFSYHNIVRIFTADTAAGCQLPKDTSFSYRGAIFKRHSSVEDSCITIDSELRVEQAQFSPSQYGSLRRFFDDVARCCEDEVAVVLGSAGQ